MTILLTSAYWAMGILVARRCIKQEGMLAPAAMVLAAVLWPWMLFLLLAVDEPNGGSE